MSLLFWFVAIWPASILLLGGVYLHDRRWNRKEGSSSSAESEEQFSYLPVYKARQLRSGGIRRAAGV